MKKRVLCFLTAMILTLLLCVPASAGCKDPDKHEDSWILDVVEDPQPGKAGYGILSCPICGEVINDHFDLPALLDPFHNDPLDPQNNKPTNPENPDTPDDPDTPDNPDGPETPEQPLTPEQPQTPDTPDNPQTPAGQDTPTEPEQPVILPGKEDNDQPGEAPQPEEPVVIPEQPLQPEPPAQQEEPVLPAVQEPAAVPDTPAEEFPDIPVPEPDEPGAGNEAPGGETGSAGRFRRPRFSKDYPYRRIKMKPEENIRAEAAGTPVWPAAASPFQKMLKHND